MAQAKSHASLGRRLLRQRETATLMNDGGLGPNTNPDGPLRAAAGRVSQKELNQAVRAAGGRSSKGVERARDAADVIRSKGRGGVFSGDRLMRMEGPMASRLVKGALRGMLSPAGLAEGVAGATVKAMRDSGAPMTPKDMLKQKGMSKGKSGPGKPRRTGERA